MGVIRKAYIIGICDYCGETVKYEEEYENPIGVQYDFLCTFKDWVSDECSIYCSNSCMGMAKKLL